VPTPAIAARFHATLALAPAHDFRRVRETRAAAAARAPAIELAALSGGCFQNTLLTEGTRAALAREGLDVLVHRKVPPNDGGVSLGQAAVAAYRLRRKAR
jgi:hydrogenase maturation protein HypF